ncbi:MAG TPA: lamin tail domain-containing protein [Polyangia bacterium]
MLARQRIPLFPQAGPGFSAAAAPQPSDFRCARGLVFAALLTAVSGFGCGGSPATGADADAKPDASSDGRADTTSGDVPAGDGPFGDGASDGRDGGGTGALVINELVADDDGFTIDEDGQTDDWLEILNRTTAPVNLTGYTVDEGGTRHPLPAGSVLAPGATLLVWADDHPMQGPRHLGFRLSTKGGRLTLRDPRGEVVDDLTYPALATNEAYARFPDGGAAFATCRYATPARNNGARCAPPPPREPPVAITYAPYAGGPLGPVLAGPLAITEVALRPARFIEVMNTSTAPVRLADFQLRVAATEPGLPLPTAQDGVLVAWPTGTTLAAGTRLMVPVREEDLAAVAARPAYEGVVGIFGADQRIIQRLDFQRLPENVALALVATGNPRAPRIYRLCKAATPGADSAACEAVAARAIGEETRQLLTADDFRALAEGDTRLDNLAVKVIVDMQAGDAVHFLSARRWPLHYTFIREQIYREPKLDRCNPAEAAQFDDGWREFSNREYFKIEGRRFLLATLVRHGGSGAMTLEFDSSDAITPELMRRAFFAVTARTLEPAAWSLRPQGDRQPAALKTIEGTVPIIDTGAPFRGITFQAVTPGIGYGVLQFMPAAELARARLGIGVIVVTDDVPLDVPLLGGLITEAFQTPLAHVSVLTRNRGTPNLALKNARTDERLLPWFNRLVRLDVGNGTFSIREATQAEAQMFWDKRKPTGPRVVPRLDTSVRNLQDLRQRSLDDLPAIGAKAAQMGELARVQSLDAMCAGPIPHPDVIYAVPVVHSLEHFEGSGARALLQTWRAKPEFATDPAVRAKGLAEVRAAILAHPVDGGLVSQIEELAKRSFADRRFRLRSSSNTEDLATFSGAGLYDSVSAALGDPERTIADGLRTVWSSLWVDRAYDERELGNIDQSQVAMGVLIHEAYNGVERANGVLVSRDIHNPIEGSVETINAQAGEASVTNPAPGVTSEELLYSWWVTPPAVVIARSNLIDTPVLTPAETALLACHIRSIELHFRGRLDPRNENPWFAMESEFKLIGPERRPIIKQARPYSFGRADIPVDCREF